MEDIGRKLREARERLGLTLSEVERTTRIRVHYLEMLESGEIDSIPSVVQARGFLKNYADFLGLNTAAVLDDFAAVLRGNHKRTQAKPTPVPAPRPATARVRARRPNWLSMDLFLAVLGGVGVVAVIIWGGGRLMASLRQDSDSGGESPPIPAATATFSNPAPTGSPPIAATGEDVLVTSTPQPTATAPNIILGPANIIDLRVVGEMRAWARVIVDGEEQFNGRVYPGDMLEFQGQQIIEIVTGNGAGLRVYFNGQDQGLLGGFSDVVIRLWSLDGAMTPTPTQVLEPPATSTPETTPTPTETGGG